MSGKNSGSGLMEQVRSFQRYHGWKVMSFRRCSTNIFFDAGLTNSGCDQVNSAVPRGNFTPSNYQHWYVCREIFGY